MSLRFDHVHLVCRDLEKTANFYKEMFGARETERLNVREAPTIRLDINGVRINLRGMRPTEKEIYTTFGLSHYGIEVDDMDKMFQKMKEKDVTFIEEPSVCLPGLRIAFLQGPSGELIELLERKPLS